MAETGLHPGVSPDVIGWREIQLCASGFPPLLAAEAAADDRFDLHAMIELVEQGCAPHLAIRILAPLERVA